MNSGKPPPPAPLPSKKKNPKYPSKTCKYAGVTFRSSRDKYQARIYKGNKEYNLGLFDVSADAALAYDVAHRLVKKISAAHGREKEALEAYVSDKNAGDWFSYGDDANANSGLDTDKLNFLRPLDFMEDREKEINESQLAGTSKHKNCPKLEELRVIVRKESIRVTKIIVGASDGGTNNYRRKNKKGTVSKEGSMESPPKKRRKSNESASSSRVKQSSTKKSSDPAYQDPNVAPAWPAKRETFYQAAGLGRQLQKALRTKQQDPPSDLPAVIPVAPAARISPQMMTQMGKSALKSMMEDPAKTVGGVGNLISKSSSDKQKHGDKNDYDLMGKGGAGKDQTSENGNNSPFPNETLEEGSISSNNPGEYNFMGMPTFFGKGANNSHIPGNHNISSQLPENYRELYKSMRNVYPGMGGVGALGPNNFFEASPEDFQRMMLARAMSQNSGMYNGVGSMMGMSNLSSLNQGSLQSDGLGDQQRGSQRQIDALKSMAQNGIDRSPPNDIHQGQFGNQTLRSMSPSTINRLRAGGFPNTQATTSQYGSEQACLEGGIYGGNRFGQQLRDALQGAQFGLNPSTLGQLSGTSRSEQQSLLQSLRQSNFPSSSQFGNSSNASGVREGINPAFDGMAQMLGMSGSSHPPPRNQGNN